MSPLQGPGLRYQALASNDVDQHASHLSCWQQQYDQLSQGRFAGTVRELWADDGPRLQVFHEHTRQQTSQQCQPWRGAVWFGIPDGRQHDALHFCGRLQAPQATRPVLRAAADASFTLRTPADFGIYGVVIDADWLARRLDTLAVHDAGAHRAALQAVQVTPAVHRAICRTIESMLHLGAAGQAAQPGGRMALQTLLDQLLGLLCGRAAEDGPPADTAASRRLATVMLARELVSRPMNHTTTVDELCAELHLTRRTLQNHFRSVVGDSPADFLKAVRMNACRRKLREGGATVQDVAAQWGFFHMGHFAHDYKQMFGELPSQTLSARSARGSSRSRPARHRPAAGPAASSGRRPAAAPATAG
ncbi:MAG: helix-turn-helix domain-containing protein [Aquincola tertiaricarbonis]|uniref:helix-turn-helix domain-containing protein n=1 Tax=Aquincola sp. J276 TaxID=2898432 RepID=UPI0021510D5A|nr:helix-turn-helix domain-containing protein [Aquincola sp. J276]MCR5866223.1 helix-turn-helix domain-containing protein [Aquincola sp. J276]